jgi:hypothetical protein
MKRVEYSYAVLSYAHDPASGEALNVGVVVTAPEAAFVDFRWEERTKRLSDAFRDFSGQTYRDAFRDFRRAIGPRSYPFGQHRLFQEELDAAALVRSIWADGGLSYRIGVKGAGLTRDPEATLEQLFERYVLDQQPGPRAEPTTSDDQVWKSFSADYPLLQRIQTASEPLRIDVPGAPLEFQHAVRNGKWHLLQPLSFDLVKSESIRDKAARWAGYGQMISRRRDIEQIVFLLGAPRRAENMQAFREAKEFLKAIELRSQLFDDTEQEASRDGIERLVRESKLPLKTGESES